MGNKAEETARRILAECGDGQFPANVAEWCRWLGIRVKTYQPENVNPGQAYLLDGQPVILVSENEPIDKQRLICAHELGHILLGHVGAWGEVPDRSDLPREEQEREAERFAENFLNDLK